MEERSLHTILTGYTKPQLEDIVEILGTPGSRHRSKAGLVEELYSYLRSEPRRWLSRLTERDLRQLRQLVHAGPGKVMSQRFSDYPSLLEAIGIVSSDDSEEHAHKIWIDSEVYDIVHKDVDEVLRAGEKNGQFAVERVGMGLMNLYGILPTERFIFLMVEWFGGHHEKEHLDRLVRSVFNAPWFKLNNCQDDMGDYMVSPCLNSTSDIFDLREMLDQTEYKRGLSWEDITQAGSGAPYFTVGMKTPEGMRLEEMYRRIGYTGFELTLALHDTWIESQYTSQPNDALFGPLLDSPYASKMDQDSWETCCQIICDYADSIPKWALCGKSARECGQALADWRSWRDGPDGHEEEEEIPGRWTMPEPTISEGFAAEMFTENYPLGFAIPHVAPDDPCPCGSGLTYRHCHGKYLS